MTTKKLTKLLALYLPYLLLGLVATNFGEAWRLAEGKELGERIMSMMGTIPMAFANPLPSLHPLDLLVGLCCGAGLRLAVYLRGKNAKKYRHGMEYGSARWGNAKDIEPFMAPKFSDNIILTKTERLMMSNRPPDPKNARNKNVLVVGGSGSGKTRFWLKPNLLQCHSSYVVTDPKGTIVLECGQAMLKNGYKVKVLNTINFKKSMHYNPFAYVHSEKDILKLVTTLMTNTKGEGSGGDPFWEKSERLLLTALIAYLHLFYLFNFSYIGLSISLGVFLYIKKYKYARRIVQLLVGLYMLVYLGLICNENMQIEGFWYYLFTGVFEAATIHYAVAKIFGPLIFGRGWCGYACWTAMVLDFLPYKVPKEPRRKIGWIRYITFAASLIFVAALFLAHVGSLERIMFWAFIIGNILYYTAGIILAFFFKDNRAFCKYICPITVFLKPMSYFSLIRLKCDKEKCVSCGKCKRVCPMNVDVTDNSRKRKNGTECILCMECVKNCPKDAL